MPLSAPGGPIGRPLRRRSPPLAGSKPPRMCRNVLLPHPEGPTIETNSCSSIESDRRSIAVTPRLSTVNVLSRSVTSSSGIVAGLLIRKRRRWSCRDLGVLPLPWGEGWGEGLWSLDRFEPPHPYPLPCGERGPTELADGSLPQTCSANLAAIRARPRSLRQV